MATINFYLRKADKKAESAIMMTYQHRGDKFRYYTRLKIASNGWNLKEQRAKANYSDCQEINCLLDDIENSLKGIEREALFNKKEYSMEVVKRKFYLRLGELSQKNDFFKVLEKFISVSKATKSKSTIQTYEATKGKLLEFSLAKNISISFESIDQNFYETFLAYLIVEKRYLNNTVGKHIKTLKVFLNYAKDHEFTNQNYNLRKFKAFSEEADIIYLTEQELLKIHRLQNLPQRLIEVRDNFCFACFTGLRFSDILKLRNYHMKGDFIEMRAEKTKDNLKVPLNEYAREILNRYKTQFEDKPLPVGISNQKSNDYLKEIGQLAELDEIVHMEKFSGSNKISTEKMKWQLLTTHTARRTFVTLALEKGIRAEIVMAMTGHKNYKTFKRYIKITDKVMQTEMERFWNKPVLRIV
jgi:site-specific recombinase XerD